MEFDKNILNIAKRELLPNIFTDICQTDDGTVYFWSFNSTPHRLYAQSKGTEIEAKLPGKEIKCVGALGNSIYFVSKDKVYKAGLSPSRVISITYLRDKYESEELYHWGLCSQLRNGKRYVYRLCDNAETDGILIDVPDEELNRLALRGIHRGMAVYFSKIPTKPHPSVHKLTANVIVIEVDTLVRTAIYARESSSSISFSLGNNIHTFDTTTMTFTSSFQLRGVMLIWYVAGIFNEEITVHAQIGDDHYLITAQQPKEPSFNGGPAGYTSRFINEFKIEKIIGAGGFGIVFEVVHELDKKKYAVKRIPVDRNEESKVLKSEVRAMATFDHSGIVRYNNTWIEKPPPGWQFESDVLMLKHIGASRSRYKMNYSYDTVFVYIQMQLCKYSLAVWLDENRTFSSRSLPRMKSWFKQLLSAVAYIHQVGLIHRDLKPGNILFVEEDHLKICDLGLVTDRREEGELHTALTRTNIGTELYMSPENRELYAKYSSKTDVFALGLILAEISVVMSYEERAKIFGDIRRGVQTTLKVDTETAQVVEALTRMDPLRRPTCKEMLEHPYFS